MINSNVQNHTEFGKLVEDAFDRFEKDPKKLPRLPFDGSPVECPGIIRTRAKCNYPWPRGRHPVMSARFKVHDALIAIMSRRPGGQQKFEPAHVNEDWGPEMKRYCELRDNLRAHVSPFNHLDAPRIVKYAYGLVTVSKKLGCDTPILVYLYPEPLAWPEDSYNSSEHTEHRREIEQFAELVDGDEVKFQPLAFNDLLQSWEMAENPEVRELARAIADKHPSLS